MADEFDDEIRRFECREAVTDTVYALSVVPPRVTGSEFTPAPTACRNGVSGSQWLNTNCCAVIAARLDFITPAKYRVRAWIWGYGENDHRGC